MQTPKTIYPELRTPRRGGNRHRTIVILLLSLGLLIRGTFRAIAQGATTSASRNHDLSITAGIGNLEKVKALLAAGADPNAADEKGVTPLMETAGWTTYDVFEVGKEERHAEIVNLLVKKGADVNLVRDGRTVLMAAAHESTVATVTMLLAKGAKVNATDNEGDAALMFAAGWNTTEVVKVLLQSGAEISHKNHAGKTALDVAVDKGRAENVALLQRTKKGAPRQ